MINWGISRNVSSNKMIHAILALVVSANPELIFWIETCDKKIIMMNLHDYFSQLLRNLAYSAGSKKALYIGKKKQHLIHFIIPTLVCSTIKLHFFVIKVTHLFAYPKSFLFIFTKIKISSLMALLPKRSINVHQSQ